MKDFEELSHKIHQVVKLDPAAVPTMSDFHKAGGVPALLKTLIDANVGIKDKLTTSGLNISQIANETYVDTNLIHLYNEPFTTEAGWYFIWKSCT